MKNLTCGPGDGPVTWVIIKDEGVVNDCRSATPEECADLVKKGFTEPFQLLDDDGELYYSGLAKPDADFDPLDNFGMPNAGCTEIKYYSKKTNSWETL